MHKRRFRMAWGTKQPKEGAATKSDVIENIIGRSCTIRGDLAAEGAFRIDGTIEGSVESRASDVNGESEATFRMAADLMRDGFYVNTAVFPAVANGQGGLRIALTLHQTLDDIRDLIDAIARRI